MTTAEMWPMRLNLTQPERPPFQPPATANVVLPESQLCVKAPELFLTLSKIRQQPSVKISLKAGPMR